MASLLDLLYGGDSTRTTGSADINAFERRIAEDDSFSKAAKAISSAKFDPRTWTPNQSLAANVAQAFTAGLLDAAGQRHQEDQVSKLTSVLPQLYADPINVQAPEGIDSGAFEGVRANAIAKDMESKQALRKTILTNMGADYDIFTGKITPNQDIQDATQSMYAAKHPGSKVDLNDPNLDPEYKKALIDTGGDVVSARQQIAMKQKLQLASIEVPAAMKSSLAQSSVVIDEAKNIANALETEGTTWADLQAGKTFAGADKAEIGQSLKILADRLGRARSGAALNSTEVKLYQGLVSGDLSASPSQVAFLLRKLADSEQKGVEKQLSFVQKINKGENPFELSPSLSSGSPEDQIREQFKGKQILSIKKIR
jgi:hypothetical protein